MKKIIVPALILTLALGFFVGRLTAPALESAPAPTTAPPTEAVPAYPIDALFAKNPYDAQTYRALWEYELREVYERYERFTAQDDDNHSGREALSRSLYAYLDYAALRAEADAERPAGPDYETALGRLYRAEAEALHEALEETGHTVNYSPFATLPDSEKLEQWETEWSRMDRLIRYELADVPLAGNWPELGTRLWGLTHYESLLEVDGHRTVLPLPIFDLWRAGPQARRIDADGNGGKEITLVFYMGGGTGASERALCILEYNPDLWPHFFPPSIFRNEDFAAMVAPYLTLEIENGDIVATAFGDTVRVPAFEDAEPFTWAEPVLSAVVSIDITEDGRLELYLGVGVITNVNPVVPIFIATLTAELGWNGEGIYLIGPSLTAD